jgi:hypothetical protein
MTAVAHLLLKDFDPAIPRTQHIDLGRVLP